MHNTDNVFENCPIIFSLAILTITFSIDSFASKRMPSFLGMPGKFTSGFNATSGST